MFQAQGLKINTFIWTTGDSGDGLGEESGSRTCSIGGLSSTMGVAREDHHGCREARKLPAAPSWSRARHHRNHLARCQPTMWKLPILPPVTKTGHRKHFCFFLSWHVKKNKCTKIKKREGGVFLGCWLGMEDQVTNLAISMVSSNSKAIIYSDIAQVAGSAWWMELKT